MYVTIEELTAEGAEGTDDRKTNAIVLAQSYIDKMTGQWFDKKSKTIKFDGKSQSLLFLPFFAISISKIEVDDSEISEDDYVLYNRFYPDDRNNPKIKFEYNLPKGSLNISITGDFGYVEEDESTPAQIKKICLLLALNEVGELSDTSRRDVIDRGRIIEEDTDGHSYKLSDVFSSGGFTGDPEIDAVLRAYQSPMKIGVA